MSPAIVKRLRGFGLATLALAAAAPAFAADLAYPPYEGETAEPSRVYREERIEEAEPPPPPLIRHRPQFVAGPYGAPQPDEECRTIVKHRIGPDGEEIERRIRICDDRPAPRFRPSFYRPHPVPPADIPYDRWREPPRW